MEHEFGKLFLEAGKYIVTSGYGMRMHPVTGINTMHNGIDLTREGKLATIIAPLDGRVVVVKNNITGNDLVNTSGNYVLLEHMDSDGFIWNTRYCHLKYGSIPDYITPGTVIKKGEVIGYMGATGNATAGHLHFELILFISSFTSSSRYLDPKKTLMEGTSIKWMDLSRFLSLMLQFPIGRPTHGGISYKSVKILQSYLNRHFLDYFREPLLVDGYFGKKTEEAMENTQCGLRISRTGIFDKQTWETINNGEQHVLDKDCLFMYIENIRDILAWMEDELVVM